MNVKVFLFRLIGIYSIIMGTLYTFIMLFGYFYQYIYYQYVYQHFNSGSTIVYYNSNNFSNNFIGIILGFIILLCAIWLIIGGLSFKKYSGILMTSLIIAQIIIEILSGFSIGLFFMPVTVIIIISEIGYILISSR
jgi:hypothetical protein